MSPSPAQFTEFVADIEPSLRRALAEEFGPLAGREATIDALAFAWANWDRVVEVDDATAYLAKVGQTAAERHRPLATGDVTPILPRSQAAFDALVLPVNADEAVDRADELVSGAPTTMLARPAAPTTVVATTPRMTVSAGPDGAGTRPTLGPSGPEPPLRRTLPWVVAVVLVGVIALGGIAFANRSSDDGDGADTTSLPTLPTLPTTAAPTTTPAPATESTPPAATTVPATETPSATQPSGDDDDDDDDGDDDGGTATTPAPAATSPTVTTPATTDAPVTDPPDTDPPATDTDPPETDPPETQPPSTSPPETTVAPRPTAPNSDPTS